MCFDNKNRPSVQGQNFALQFLRDCSIRSTDKVMVGSATGQRMPPLIYYHVSTPIFSWCANYQESTISRNQANKLGKQVAAGYKYRDTERVVIVAIN